MSTLVFKSRTTHSSSAGRCGRCWEYRLGFVRENLKWGRRLSVGSVVMLFVLGGTPTSAQSSNASLNEDYYHWIDRYETKSGNLSPALFTTVKPYQRKAIAALTDSLEKSGTFISKADLFNRQFLNNDNWDGANRNRARTQIRFSKHSIGRNLISFRWTKRTLRCT
jgi:hypothetical protein